MPSIFLGNQKPSYRSVDAYLVELAKDIAELVARDTAVKERFREQIHIYNQMWEQWKTAEQATQNKTWVPSMGRPECPLNFFSPTYNIHYTPERESNQLPGFYSLMAFIHDREWTHVEKINNGIISSEELIEKTFSAPRSTLEGRLIVPGIPNGPDVREIYVIEECFNHVRIDIREFYRTLDDSVGKKERKAQCDNIEELSDEQLFAKVAQLFDPTVIIPLNKNETWLDLDHFLKPWFEAALQRLESKGESKQVRLLRYKYQNLQHYARGADFKSFRGWRDPFFGGKTTELAAELAKDFKDLRPQRESKSPEASGGSERDNIQQTSPTIKRQIEAIRVQVFICYSHKDERWLGDLQKHLKPYVRDGSITAWSDKQITPGSKWFTEIKAALESTKVAVLLVTPDFLASDFIHKHELGPLLKEAEKGGVCILWIPVRACSYKKTPLKDYQAVIDPDKPLVNMRLNRDKAWVKICEEIEKAVKS